MQKDQDQVTRLDWAMDDDIAAHRLFGLGDMGGISFSSGHSLQTDILRTERGDWGRGRLEEPR